MNVTKQTIALAIFSGIAIQAGYKFETKPIEIERPMLGRLAQAANAIIVKNNTASTKAINLKNFGVPGKAYEKTSVAAGESAVIKSFDPTSLRAIKVGNNKIIFDSFADNKVSDKLTLHNEQGREFHVLIKHADGTQEDILLDKHFHSGYMKEIAMRNEKVRMVTFAENGDLVVMLGNVRQ